jgi:hypothetical protein
MLITKNGFSNDVFIDELKKLLPKKAAVETVDVPQEGQLSADRDDKKQEADTAPLEVQIGTDRKPAEEPALYEKLLDEHRMAFSDKENVKLEGVTEKRLNDASKDAYPHRNEKAYRRTGEKRQINALPEELGSASDEAKQKRYDKALKAQETTKRLVDKDIGSQLTNKKAFNLKKTRVAMASACASYVAYKDETAGNTRTAGDRFAEVRRLDSVMSSIMEDAQGEKRLLTDDESAQIVAMKQRKSSLLCIRL